MEEERQRKIREQRDENVGRGRAKCPPRACGHDFEILSHTKKNYSFRPWKDADPDIPIFIAAKAEYAKLK
jgi:hypothetical protein